MNLRGARVLVTGASGGIGRETARALAAAGAHVAISGRRTEELEKLADVIRADGCPNPVVLTADLALPGAAEDLVRRANAALGSVDVLINDAAVEGLGSYSDAADNAKAREMFEINYWSPMTLVRLVIPSMRERGRGAIVNVSSLGAITPIPDTGHYPSTKAALAVATEALRRELRSSGVQVVLVYPGLVETPMLRAFRARPHLPQSWRTSLRLMPIGRPEKLARLIVRSIRRGRKTVVYPRSFALAPHFPSIARRLTALLFPIAVFARADGDRCACWPSLKLLRCRSSRLTSGSSAPA